MNKGILRTLLRLMLCFVTAVAGAASCSAPAEQRASLGHENEPLLEPRPILVGTVSAASPCADGTVEQTFDRGVVGCAGSVTFPNRASLCGPGYHAANAMAWHTVSTAGPVPTHHYWTNDALTYTGTASGSCSAQYTRGTTCPADQPMRVCGTTTTDPEGNRCNWLNCAFDSGGTTPNEYFGGCAGNTTAGTLCVPNSGCADGTSEQTFQRGMTGCAGSVTYADAARLCTAGFQPATERDWLLYRAGAAPTHDYWVAQAPLHYSGNASACVATSTSTDPTCPSSTPMRVCIPGGSDPEGNHCNWSNCGSSSSASTSPNEYFGGCIGNTTAGTLCVQAYGCADGTIEQQWDKFIVGCAGSVSYPNRDSLCGSRGIAVPIGVWPSFAPRMAPTHNYWAGQPLLWNGTGSGNCWVSQSSGSSCLPNQPMHICTGSGSDAEGNTCVWTHCGVNTATPDLFMGGCGASAGTVCMTGP